jgi:glycerate-2-kinase
VFIKNFREIAKTPERKIALELVEAGLAAIQPEEVFKTQVRRHWNTLTIGEKEFNLDNFERVFILGFGKGSAGNARLLEKLILDRLTEGFVIDTEGEEFEKIKFTKGTHPLPSETNHKFTQKVLEKFSNLNEKDLVLVVICGGGSAMLVHPHAISLEQQITISKALLKSGANITEMNIVRKHLSDVKGGGLAQILYPATVAALIYSDVPGNDLSTIASGPTAMDYSTVEDALAIIKKYRLETELGLPRSAFVEKPRDKKYFENVFNIIVLSNDTALFAMFKRARELGRQAKIFSDRFEGEARKAGKKLIEEVDPGSILLVGGETTVKVSKNSGKGGRNQELVLAALEYVCRDVTICSFASDGWDNTDFAGAIGDFKTVERAKELGVEPLKYLEKNNSFEFFKKTGDGIETGRLPSNVSDIVIILKKVHAKLNDR